MNFETKTKQEQFDKKKWNKAKNKPINTNIIKTKKKPKKKQKKDEFSSDPTISKVVKTFLWIVLFLIGYIVGLGLGMMVAEIGCFAWIALMFNDFNHDRFSDSPKFWTQIFTFIKNSASNKDENARLAVINHFLCQRRINKDEKMLTFLQSFLPFFLFFFETFDH